MPDQITQVMAIDAASALATLAQLDQGFQRFENRLNSVGKTLQGFNGNSSAAAKSLGTSFKSGFGEATASTDKLHTSLRLLSRVVFTQAIVRGLSQIRNAIQSTAKEAIDFQKALALISTIDDSKQSMGRLSEAARKLSDDFNVPLLETTKGLYQSLSNQVGDFGTSLEFTADAAQFAKATNSSLADSVDLLSGALKSYNLDASETDRVSGVFFKTIDLGRITATELANSFGRVGPIAAELGVSLEETGGALAAISVKGSKTAETLTQFRAILSALQKPTPELTKALNDLGFSGSEAAIKTLGLPGVLRSLADSAGGSAEKMAQLFPNIRGLAGATSLASDDFKTLATNIDEMTAAGANLSKEKFLAATATDAERVTKEINKLKNAFTVELGQSVLKAGADLSQFVGGADRVIEVTKAAGPALVGLAGSFLLFRGSIAASNLELAGLSRSLGLLALLPAAQGLGTSIGTGLENKRGEIAGRALAALQDQNAKDAETFKQQQADKLAAASKADDARVKSTLRVVQQLQRAYLTDLDNAKRSNDGLVANTTAALDKILGAREKLVDALAKGAADSRTIAKDSRGRQTEVSDRANDRAFDNSTKRLNDAGQVFALTKRAQELASQAASDLARAGKSGDTDAISRAAAAFQKAQTLGESAQQIGERANNRGLEARAANALADVTNRQLVAEQQLQNIQQQRAAALDKERTKQAAIVDEIRKQTKVVLDNTSQFDANGNTFNETDQSKRNALRQAALKKIAESALSQKDLTATSALGLADFVSRNQAALANDPINLAFSTEKAVAKIQADLKASFANFRLGINLDPLESALGKKIGSTSPDQSVNLVSEGQAKLAALRQQIAEAEAGSQKIQSVQKELDTVFSGVAGRKGVRGAFDNPDLRQQFDTAVAGFQKVRQQSEITATDVRKVFDELAKVHHESNRDITGRLGFSTDLEELAKATLLLQKLSEAKAASKTDTGAAQQLQRLEAALQQTNPADRFKAATDAISAGVAPAEKIANAYERAALAIEKVAQFQPAQGKAIGGMMSHFAAGGAAKGTDTIPALLSPGEFVVNARSSQRFFAQLQSINAGQAPSFGPGVVNNNGIGGDLNINVDASGGGQVIAREVAAALRRELRRGTVART